ncbi:Rha family transcriptional regulator [Pseudomonas sp. WS 5412]|nr:Rha family transcriptional regulator [Pseudomonas sp. WS 5412]
MSSREIAELTGKRHFHVTTDIEKMLADLKEDATGFRAIYLDSMNREQTEYLLDREHTDCLLTGYSAAMRMVVIKRWRELEEQAARPMTQAEITAANANHLVAVERQQREQQVALERIETRVANVEQVRYLDSRPAGFESMTTIRERINLRHGIPPWVINAVMRDIPGAPLPFAMVRSNHADDGAQPYAIWPKADITRRFDRFVTECTLVTAERATHPDIQQGRFKLRQRTSA